MSGTPSEKPRDRRFSAAEWQDDPYYRAIRDAYLLASKQLRETVEKSAGERFAGRDGALPARPISERDFARPISRRPIPKSSSAPRRPAAQNLVQGFLNLLEDVGSGKGIVQRRTDPDAFKKGETIAATPGAVVFENALFQLIQYNPTTDKVAAEPLLYVPPLVNRYYMIDLVPRQSLVKWLVDEGRTVFVISWVNPGNELKDKDVGDYVVEGIVEAIGAVRERTGARPTCSPSALAGRSWRSRSPIWPRRAARKEVNSRDADRFAGRFFGHARLGGVRSRKPSSALEAHLDGRAMPTAWSCSGCSRRCGPTT